MIVKGLMVGRTPSEGELTFYGVGTRVGSTFVSDTRAK